MIKLTERLKKIVSYIDEGEGVADIGTDHGYLPLYLLEQNPVRKIIFTDVNEGPLAKTVSIIKKEYPEADFSGINQESSATTGDMTKSEYPGVDFAGFDLRLGDGLVPVKPGEVDTIVIAGMGGLLIKDILARDFNKTMSFGKLILQPRTAAAKLRKWLVEQELYIFDETLAYEYGRICEIIAVSPGDCRVNHEFITDFDYEFSPIILKENSEIVRTWISGILKKEKEIKESLTAGILSKEKEIKESLTAGIISKEKETIESLTTGGVTEDKAAGSNEDSSVKLINTEKRIEKLERLLSGKGEVKCP